MKKKLFCFGLGYSAQQLIQHLRQQDDGWQFAGTSRTAPDHPMDDVEYHLFADDSPLKNIDQILSDVTHILTSAAPNTAVGDPVLHHHYTDLAKLKHIEWVGYLSTTGVYGNRDGDWVDDETPPAPTSEKGHLRLSAEQGWLKLFHDHHLPVHLFRLGSIYGPGRGHLVNLKAGRVKKIIKPGQYFSRIHVDDIARVLMASLTKPNAGQSYNLVDNLPAPTPEVLDYICDLLGREPLPPTDINDADLSPMMKIFYSENKRVRNDRIRHELGVILEYPTYKEGFLSLLK